MSTELYAQAKAIFQKAIGVPPAERAAFLDEACAGDEALRREVESWLAASEKAGSFLEGAAVRLCSACHATFPDETQFCPHCGQPLEEDPKALVGARLDNLYQIEELLGCGGMGAVYRARHVLLGDRVAIKMLRREYSGSPSFLKRFQREGRAARAFRHPNAVTVHDLRVTPAGVIYMVLEYVEGHTLRHEMKKYGPFTPAETAELLEPVASVLAAAHAAGVIHRDLKPENIMVSRDAAGRRSVKVLDLGIAKLRDAAVDQPQTNLTVAGQIIGTPQYMSPEQWGELPRDGRSEIDARADVYSLGVIAYELLTGRWPYSGSTLQELRRAHVTAAAPAPHVVRTAVPAEVGRVVARALAKDRADRTPSAAEFIEELRRAAFASEAEGGAGEAASSPDATLVEGGGTRPVQGAATAVVGAMTEVAASTPVPKIPAVEPIPVAGAMPRRARPEAPEPATLDRPSGGPRRKAVILAAAVLAAVALAVWLLSRGAAPGVAPPIASEPEPPAEAPVAPAEAMTFYVEVEQPGGASRRTTGLEPVPAGRGLRFHLVPAERGYLALVAPDREGVPFLFLPAAEDGLLERGSEVAFPDDTWLETTAEIYKHTLTVVYSPTADAVPDMLRGQSRRLSPAEQQQFEAFRRENEVAPAEYGVDSSGEPAVRVPWRETSRPVVFDISVMNE